VAGFALLGRSWDIGVSIYVVGVTPDVLAIHPELRNSLEVLSPNAKDNGFLFSELLISDAVLFQTVFQFVAPWAAFASHEDCFVGFLGEKGAGLEVVERLEPHLPCG
jgi:hypothetical protein